MRATGMMSKPLFILFMSFLLAIGSMPLANRSVSAATSFSNVSMNTTTPAMYDKFEMTFNLSSTYTNPFNPDEVNVTATFTTPSGAVESVPGFYRSDSSPKWAVRYSTSPQLAAYLALRQMRQRTPQRPLLQQA